jgi:DNA polymerase-1
MAEPTPKNTLYLIDGHAQIFRAYYAIRGGLTSPVTGEPTNATFAFTGMLIKLFSQFNPQYVVMAIDSQGKTFRDEVYSEYKAHREAPPSDFAVQIPRILEITRLFGIPVLAKPGAEADDIIATVAQRTLANDAYGDVHVRVVSKDKDLEQLLGPRVTMFDIHTDTTIDTQWLKENKGITPEQVVDILTLTGDTVDNIPGVSGVGPKTAAKLVQEFGSVEGIVSNLDKIKGKLRDNIENALPFLPLARQLVTLDRDIAIDFDMADAKAGKMEADALEHLFRQLGFTRHLNDLKRLVERRPTTKPQPPASAASEGLFAPSLFEQTIGEVRQEPVTDVQTMVQAAEAAGLSTALQYDYRAITTARQLEELVHTLRTQRIISVDTETIGLGHRSALCGICLAWKSGSGVYVPLCSPAPQQHLDAATVISALRPILEDPAIPKCGHNLKYDMLVLKHAGMELRGIAFDSMIAAFLVGAPAQALDHLAMSELKHQMIPISSLIGPRVARGRGPVQKTMDQVPLELITPYAAEDADIALRLYELFEPRLTELGMSHLASEVEMPLVEVLALMEHRGIRVNPDVLDEQKKELATRIIELRDRIHEAVGTPFNMDSPKQLAAVLFKQLKLPVVKRTKSGPSTDIEVLEKLCEMEGLDGAAQSVPVMMVEYRQLTKLVGTYLESLKESIHQDTGRIHASFHQTGAATGRLSSSGPNLQNIPIRSDLGRQIRKAFVADDGCVLISADYSQVELRVLAHLSSDPALIQAFQQDLDIHTAVACEVFGVPLDQVTSAQRGHAKVINFGIIYGVTAYGLARRIEGLDVQAAKKLITDYRARFAGIDRFLARCIDQAATHGYVKTILGRRRPIPQIGSANPNTRALGERLAINTVVQGSAADLIKQAMVNLHRRIRRETLPMDLLLQIHDELVLETPAEHAQACAAIVKQEMEQAMTLKVPLKVELGMGEDWLSAK